MTNMNIMLLHEGIKYKEFQHKILICHLATYHA